MGAINLIIHHKWQLWTFQHKKCIKLGFPPRDLNFSPAMFNLKPKAILVCIFVMGDINTATLPVPPKENARTSDSIKQYNTIHAYENNIDNLGKQNPNAQGWT